MAGMQIDFWFDPSCPYTWVTSRWACRVAPERSLTIRWRSFSLAILHEDEGPSEKAVRALGQLRVIEAARKAGLEYRVGHLYSELGWRTHDHGDRDFPVADALASCGLPLDLADAADDLAFDDVIRASMDEASALTGDDAGVPVVAWGAGDEQVGFFGPILTELPEASEGERLFDLIADVVSVPAFTELKRLRSRPVLPAERND
jgi:hypothetical protein